MALSWRGRISTYWCSNCGVPLLSRSCDRCGAKGRLVKGLSPPGDLRIAFKGDLKLLRSAVKGEFGTEKAYEALGLSGALVLFNKAIDVDLAYQVVAHGAVLGYLYYEPWEELWRFKPSPHSARAIAEHVPEVAFETEKFDKGKAKEALKRVGARTIVVLARGEVGYATKVGSRVLARAWPEPPPLLARKASWQNAVEANETALRFAESRACVFVYKLSKKRSKVVVAYSGGKDSLATLSIASKSLESYVLFFNDTGLELPETVENVEKIAEKFGAELVVGSAGDRFWEDVEFFGPPARDYRWCCKVLKLIPTLKAYREMGSPLSLVGQRKWESLARFASPSVWRNRWLPGVLNASPINEWSALQVWLYLLKENLPYNPLYELGFDRIGCWLCPACQMADFEVLKRTHWELWQRWQGFLEKWAERRSLPEAWLKLGLWRWKRLPRKMWKYLEELNLGYREPSSEPKVRAFASKSERTAKLYVAGGRANYELLKSVGEVELAAGGAVKVVADSFTLALQGNEAVLKVRGTEALEKAVNTAVKALLRAFHCKACGFCVYICPKGAISEKNGKMKVDEGKCVRCGLCLDSCFVSLYCDVDVSFQS